MEQRTLWLSGELAGWDDWPGLQTVLKVRREVSGRKGKPPSVEEGYAICSLAPGRLKPVEFLELWREHWAVENRLHWVLDVTMGEDACQVRTDQAPSILGHCRAAVLSCLRWAGEPNIAAALRRLSIKTDEALKLLGIT